MRGSAAQIQSALPARPVFAQLSSDAAGDSSARFTNGISTFGAKHAISVIGIAFPHSAVRTSQTPLLGSADAPPSSRADRAAR